MSELISSRNVRGGAGTKMYLDSFFLFFFALSYGCIESENIKKFESIVFNSECREEGGGGRAGGGVGLVYQIVIIKTFSKYSITIPKCNNKV